jgi:hypothetical protein
MRHRAVVEITERREVVGAVHEVPGVEPLDGHVPGVAPRRVFSFLGQELLPERRRRLVVRVGLHVVDEGEKRPVSVAVDPGPEPVGDQGGPLVLEAAARLDLVNAHPPGRHEGRRRAPIQVMEVLEPPHETGLVAQPWLPGKGRRAQSHLRKVLGHGGKAIVQELVLPGGVVDRRVLAGEHGRV